MRLFVKYMLMPLSLHFMTMTLVAQKNSSFSYTTIKEIHSSNAAVVSAHSLASEAGLEIMKQGGNAIDAAITTQLVLAVVYPGAGNLGGGGFMVAHLNNGKNLAIDYREKAPGKASRDMYLDSVGNPKLNLSQDGHLAAGIPGTVAGIFASLPYAKLPFKKLIQPAIDIAEKGFVLTAYQARSFNDFKKEFIQNNTTTPVFVRNEPWKVGDTLIQKDLANTLKRIQKDGSKGFYEGKTAQLIVAEMQKAGGIITLEDLKNYKAAEREILQFNYKGFEILTMPLPSSGGIILGQMLKMIEHRNIGQYKFNSPLAVQLMTEVERRAFADRGEFLGDPDFVKVPVKTLLDSVYLQTRMNDFVVGKAGNSSITKPGNIYESDETTHLSIVDNEGNAVAVTTTLNGVYGSRTVVSGAGFLLNNEMDDFSVKPGVPNMYGAIGNDKNAIAPGKRMLSSMTPTIVLKNNQPFLVVGTPGGTTIPTSVFQTLVNIIDFNLTVSEAVNFPKFHHQFIPDLITIEKDFSQQTRDSLVVMGYKLKVVNQIGRTEVIKIDQLPQNNLKKANKIIIAVADKRGDDAAAGF